MTEALAAHGGGGSAIPADAVAAMSMAGNIDYAKVEKLAGGGRILSDGVVGVHAGEVVGTPSQVGGGQADPQMLGLLAQLVDLQRQALAKGTAVMVDGQTLMTTVAQGIRDNRGGSLTAIRDMVL